MAILSTNPYVFIEEFRNLLTQVSELTNKIKEKFENKYKLQQKKIENQNITVEMVRTKISNLYDIYSMTKEVLDNANK